MAGKTLRIYLRPHPSLLLSTPNESGRQKIVDKALRARQKREQIKQRKK